MEIGSENDHTTYNLLFISGILQVVFYTYKYCCVFHTIY